MLIETLRLLAPEIVLAVAAVLIYLGGAFAASHRVWRWAAMAAVVLAGVCLGVWPGRPASSVPLEMDPLAGHIRLLALVLGGLLLLAAWRASAGRQTAEYQGSLLLVIAGMMLTASANDLVLLFVGLELVSIPTYILLYLGRRDARSQEAAAKYFYLSVLASATLLYGFSFLYGASGSMDLGLVHARIISAGGGPLAKIALVLIFAGLGFKIAAVPFHLYAPDVYEGTTHANAALLSVAPKLVGLVALVRVVAVGLAGAHSAAWPIALVLAALTMTLGNVVALWQDNLRRLLAYSSIAHAGYMLIGLAVWMAPRTGPASEWNGLASLLFYLATYAVATLGTFAALACLGASALPSAGEGSNTESSLPSAREGANTGSPLPSAGEGANTGSPLPSACEGANTGSPLPSAGEGLGVRALDREIDSLDELASLAWTGGPGIHRARSVLAWAIALFMLSLAGLPPLFGFWGKLAIFASSLSLGGLEEHVRPWFVALAVIGVVNSAIAAAYYLRVVGVMFFRVGPAAPQTNASAGGTLWATLACATLVVVLGFVPGFWLREADSAAPSPDVAEPPASATLNVGDRPGGMPSRGAAAGAHVDRTGAMPTRRFAS